MSDDSERKEWLRGRVRAGNDAARELSEWSPPENSLRKAARLKHMQLEREIRESSATPNQKSNMQHTLSKLSMFWSDSSEERIRDAWKAGARSVPSNADRSAYFTAHRTSTAAQVSRRPLSDRLIDVAALCFLRGLALVGWAKRRLQ